MKVLEPKHWEVEFNFSAIASIVSPSIDSLEIKGCFRSNSDLVAMIYKSDDDRMHTLAKYPSCTDYTGVKFKFDAEFISCIPFNDTTLLPAMTVTYADESIRYVTLGYASSSKASASAGVSNFSGPTSLGHDWVVWDSEVVTWWKNVVIGYENNFDSEGNFTGVSEITEYREGTAVRGSDYVINYTLGLIYPVAGGMPYEPHINVEYEYHIHDSYEIDFDNLYEGTQADHLEKISPNNIKRIFLPIIPLAYDKLSLVYTGQSVPFSININNIVITGPDIGEYPSGLPEHGYKIAEGYDDEYYRNPLRLADAIYKLGFRDVVNLYVGASHYYDKVGAIGEPSYENGELVPENGLNPAAKNWFLYFLKGLKANGINSLIISMSMENLSLPKSWRQRYYASPSERGYGQTGWTPPTYFFSPTNEDAKSYWESIVREYLDIAVSESFVPILQLGEPWWWWQEFIPGDVTMPFPGRPPCFYDDATMSLYQLEKGKSLPIFYTSDIDMTNPDNIEATAWLRDKLGAFSNFAKSIVKSYTGGLYTVLFFPPSVLDTQRVPEGLRIANYPKSNWVYPNLDFIQIEDYDWLIHKNKRHKEIFNFAQDYLGYPTDKSNYFAGFAWDMYEGISIEEQWKRIDTASNIALTIGISNVFIWAGTQIRRDDWDLPKDVFVRASVYTMINDTPVLIPYSKIEVGESKKIKDVFFFNTD